MSLNAIASCRSTLRGDGSLGHGPLLLLAVMASFAHPHEFEADFDTATKPKGGWAKAAGLNKGRIREYEAELEWRGFIEDVGGGWQLSWSRAALLADGAGYVRLDLVPLMMADVPVHARRLHLILQTFGLMGDRGCYAGQATLADAMCCSIRAVRSTLDVLMTHGLVNVRRRRHRSNLVTDCTHHKFMRLPVSVHETSGLGS